jgi:REP element-mobilizing transposase RayT
MVTEPLAYFISFHTYGTWLHGDKKGSVDRRRKTFGEPFVMPDQHRTQASEARMDAPPFTLQAAHRGVVHETIEEVCEHRAWTLHALHVRTNHVHIVVSAETHTPERVMNDFKSWCTRRLREEKLIGDATHVWSRHGSTEYLWKEDQVAAARDYVLNRQGAPLAMHSRTKRSPDSEPPDSEPQYSEPRP